MKKEYTMKQVVKLLEQISANTSGQPRAVMPYQTIGGIRMFSELSPASKKMIDKRIQKGTKKTRRKVRSLGYQVSNQMEKIYDLMSDTDNSFSALSLLTSFQLYNIHFHSTIIRSVEKVFEALQAAVPDSVDLKKIFKESLDKDLVESEVNWDEAAEHNANIAGLLQLMNRLNEHVMFSDPENGDDDYLIERCQRDGAGTQVCCKCAKEGCHNSGQECEDPGDDGDEEDD